MSVVSGNVNLKHEITFVSPIVCTYAITIIEASTFNILTKRDSSRGTVILSTYGLLLFRMPDSFTSDL